MKKQFDLEYYLAHPDVKVVTRDGRDVRILCTDLQDDDYPIAVSFINLTGTALDLDNYAADGKFLCGSHFENNRDLLFDFPDPKIKKVPLTYEDLMERVKAGKTMWVVSPSPDDGSDMCAFLITDISPDGTFCTSSFEFEENSVLLNGGNHFIDGTPCWKEVEE